MGVLDVMRQAPDYTARYNTPLSPADEHHFQQWLRAQGRGGDVRDYDMRGAWSAGIGADPAQRGHFPDTYKKPNHPTFSGESIYSTPETPGGSWVDQGNDRWAYAPTPFVLNMQGPQQLRNYFSRVEPGSQLIMPAPYR